MIEKLKESRKKLEDVESVLISSICLDMVMIGLSTASIGISVSRSTNYWFLVIFSIYFLFRVIKNSVDLGEHIGERHAKEKILKLKESAGTREKSQIDKIINLLDKKDDGSIN